MQPASGRLASWLNVLADELVLRAVFGAMLIGTMTLLSRDYMELAQRADEDMAAPSVPATLAAPGPLPARRDRAKEAAPVRISDKELRAAMTFELVGDGRLLATGTITPGIAEVFAAEIEKRGSYVKTVVLHSPGGSVQDAIRIGRLIRERKFNTEVAAGRYCASSCPLVFAGGIERRAGHKAAIGVHQVFALTKAAAGADGMDDAQRVSAQCQKYLREMGVDLEVWLHAMETPKDSLFYFRPDELLRLRLATQAGKPVARAAG